MSGFKFDFESQMFNVVSYFWHVSLSLYLKAWQWFSCALLNSHVMCIDPQTKRQKLKGFHQNGLNLSHTELKKKVGDVFLTCINLHRSELILWLWPSIAKQALCCLSLNGLGWLTACVFSKTSCFSEVNRCRDNIFPLCFDKPSLSFL